MKLFLSIVMLIAMATTAVAQAPLPPAAGIYYSDPLPGSSFVSGHFSESWVGTGRDGQLGNTINAASWDGTDLGTVWKLWCPSIASPPEFVRDTRDENGSGEVVWHTEYLGGHFWLSQNGPWSSDNAIDFTGDCLSFDVTTTYQFVFGEVIGIRSNVTMQGRFDLLDPSWDDFCMVYEINNAAFFGNTDDVGPLPAEFPPFIDDNCQTGTMSRGGWGDVTHITMRIIGCTVPAEETSWGAVKALYQ